MRITDANVVNKNINKTNAEFLGKVAATAFMAYCGKLFGDSEYKFYGKPAMEYGKALSIPDEFFSDFVEAYNATVMFGVNDREKDDVLNFCELNHSILFAAFKKVIVG